MLVRFAAISALDPSDHVEATTAGDAAMWLGAVALWLLGVALFVYRKLRASR